MIVVKIKGGLGNQLFQYAFARAFQENRRDDKLILDVSGFEKDKQRNFSLSNFELSNKCDIEESNKYNARYDRLTNQFLRVATKIMPRIAFKYLSRKGILVWDRIDYIEIPKIDNENVYINGYWQSEKYFSSIKSQLKKEIICPIKDVQLLEKIRNSNSVCVHIRRGDYLLPQNHLLVCTEKYYKAAINKILENFHDAKFFVFSDDIDEVKRMNFFDKKLKEQVHFVENFHPDYEEIMLMSSCNHFIISNSSFSWWAQYLTNNANAVIVAPSIWYDDGRRTDIHLKNWLLLSPQGLEVK